MKFSKEHACLLIYSQYYTLLDIDFGPNHACSPFAKHRLLLVHFVIPMPSLATPKQFQTDNCRYNISDKFMTVVHAKPMTNAEPDYPQLLSNLTTVDTTTYEYVFATVNTTFIMQRIVYRRYITAWA